MPYRNHPLGKTFRRDGRRFPNPDYERFRPGTRVKIAPWTDAFVRGFAFGTVTRVGTAYVTVAWSANDQVTIRFTSDSIMPVDEEN